MDQTLTTAVAEWLSTKIDKARRFTTYVDARREFEAAEEVERKARESLGKFVSKEADIHSVIQALSDGRVVLIERHNGFAEPHVKVFGTDGKLADIS